MADTDTSTEIDESDKENVTLSTNDSGIDDAPRQKSPKTAAVQYVEKEDSELYTIQSNLGEGAYGEVLLVTDKHDMNLSVALKVMDLTKFPNAAREGKKEALLQQMLSERGHHPNVIQCIGYRIDDRYLRLFLEFADGGELFDQIQPDVGVGSSGRAQHFFRQLMDGMAFIHQNGVTHRDIKPENLFLTKNDVLKIGDFGLATIFRHDGVERVLCVRCGTKPYASPELLKGKYHAEPSDMWSCGIVLVTMLTGELPWQEPTKADAQFTKWIKRDESMMQQRPWSKIDTDALSLLRSILNDDEKTRATIERIVQHPWCTARLNDPLPCKKSRLDCDEYPAAAISQPLYTRAKRMFAAPPTHDDSSNDSVDSIRSFSQPARPDSLLLSETQGGCSQRLSGKEALTRLARRMTRFCVTTDVALTTQRILSVASANGILTTIKNSSAEFVCTLGEIVFIVTIYTMADMEDTEPRIMVDFRRSRGCGIEFKRVFRRLRPGFADIICYAATSWLEAHGLTHSQMVQ